MQLKNILVPIDGSDNADRALDFALGLSEKFDAAITVLNVSESLPMSAVPIEPAATPIPVISGDFRKIHDEILLKAVARAKAAKPNVAISTLLREGDPAAEIVRCAKEGAFDAVVLGHKGFGKMREFLMGSISEKVAHLAPCPVIIVK